MALVGLATVLLLLAYLPGAVAAADTREKGFQAALEVVAVHWQPGDRVATVAPASCYLVLDRCDFFALGLDYEEFVYRDQQGRLVDRWLGLPLIRTAEDLAAVLEDGGRLWLVTDEGRLRKRFEPEFAQMVWQRMALLDNTDQVLVFRSEPAAEPAVTRPVSAVFDEQVVLVSYDLGQHDEQPDELGWGQVIARPGRPLPLTLHWQAIQPLATQYTVFVHLLGADGQWAAQDDGPPLAGLQPMSHWLVGELLPDRRVLDLPAHLQPGHYRLVVGLYTAEGDRRLPVVDAASRPLGEALTLDYVRILAPGEILPSPDRPLEVVFARDEDRICLLGYHLESDTTRPGDRLRLTLYWQALERVGADYTVFVHLLDSQEQIQGQGDGLPLGGFYPTSFWDPGEVVVDEHEVLIKAEAPAGTHRLVVGLYLAPTGPRLTTADGDRLLLGEVRIER
jgi:hypothetical protein